MVIVQLIVVFAASVILTSLIIPFLRNAAVQNSIVDIPNDRKIHQDAIPRLGGIGIAISFLIAMVLGYVFFEEKITKSPTELVGICIGGAVVFLIGVIDDVKGLNASKKFTGQSLAAFSLLPFGFLLETLYIPFIGVVNLGPFGIILTIFWVVGITNAFNLIDGIDGLAGGATVVASIILLIISALAGNFLMMIVCLAIVGSTIGFLWYNWNPASIFMGDCGAMFLGFVLAAVSIKIPYKGSTAVDMFVPILALGLPITDTFTSIARRLLHGKPVFVADKEHIHHKLLDTGLSVRKAVLLLYGVCSLLGAAALAVYIVSDKIAVGIVIGMLLAAVFGMLLLNKLVKERSTNIQSTVKNVQKVSSGE